MINLLYIGLVLLGLCSLFCINYGRQSGTVIILVLLGIDGWLFINPVHGNLQFINIWMILNLLFAATELFGVILHRYTLVYLPQIYCTLVGVFGLITHVHPENIWIRIVCGIGYVMIAILFVIFAIASASPDLFIKLFLKRPYKKDRQEKYAEQELENGVRLYSNVCYGTSYPLSKLDIYVTNGQEAPLFFYIHGGGYAGGDKVEGDPNVKNTGFLWYFGQIMNAGFNVVSVNYALAPEYKYPTPMYQLSEAVTFLKENGKDYGICADRIVFSGSSAGGNLAGQFVNIQTNEEYAEELKIKPVLNKENIEAVVFHSSLLDNRRFAKSCNGSLLLDYIWFLSGRAYFKAGYLDTNPDAEQSDVITHVTADFPRTYISDANTGSFLDQGKDLHKKLNLLKIENKAYFVERSEGITRHGYEACNTEFGVKNMEQLISFLCLQKC